LRRVPAGAENLGVDEDAADKLMELLEKCDGVVSAGTGSWDATVSVQAAQRWERKPGRPQKVEVAPKTSSAAATPGR
jgi:hypothetical protein